MKQQIYDRLKTVIDPETNINIVDMGFIYDVQILNKDIVKSEDPLKINGPFIKITYTLTTPGCPLASVLQRMVWDSLADLPVNVKDFNPQKHVLMDLTFDPPWTLEHMSAEARAELGF